MSDKDSFRSEMIDNNEYQQKSKKYKRSPNREWVVLKDNANVNDFNALADNTFHFTSGGVKVCRLHMDCSHCMKFNIGNIYESGVHSTKFNIKCEGIPY